MRYFNKRDIIKWQNNVRAGEGRRFIARIQVQAISIDPTAAPLDPTSEHNDPTTDTVFSGTGIFTLAKDQSTLGFNAVVKRTGTLEVHSRFQKLFEQAYSVQVGEELGSFEILGITTDLNKVSCCIALQARQ